MTLIGNIEPFSPHQSDIITYIERIEQLFICNDVDENKKVPLFLTLLGREAYCILKDLSLPELPSQKTYIVLKEALINHYYSKKLVIAERYKFYNVSQNINENINSYRAKLKDLSKYCEFGSFLDEALRDKFICGINSERIKQRLLTVDGLTFERACEIAVRMELEYQTRVMPGNDKGNIVGVNQLDNGKNNGKLNEESSQNKSNECSNYTQANQQSSSKVLPTRRGCKRYSKVQKDYNAINGRCYTCNQMDHTSKSSMCKIYNTENEKRGINKGNQEEDNDAFEIGFIDINKIGALEETRKKVGLNYTTSCDETKERRKRIVFEKQFDNIYDCDDSVDNDCDLPPQLCKTPYKKLKIGKSWNLSENKFLYDKQFSHKKQLSCDKVSQSATEFSSSTPKRSLCNKPQTQIVDPLQVSEHNDLNESLEPDEINNLEFISTTSPLVVISDIEKLIPICMETLKYVKRIDERLKVLEGDATHIEEPTNFDNILPINSIQNLKQFEENIDSSEIKTNFIEFIKRIGGKDNKNMVQRCLKRLFTNEFGIACSWCGRGNNYRMCDLKCICILKSVLRAKGVTESEFETIASEWFRLSKLRHERENKKILPDDCSTQEKET